MSEIDEEPILDSLEEESWSGLETEDASKILRGLEALIPGILKRSIISGLNAAVSEDGIRSMVSDKRDIPKDAVTFVLSQADSTRRELLRIVSREVRLFLENMDFGGEIAKILTTLSFEIRTEVRFIPNDEAVKPNIRNRVKVKRVREDGKEETVSEFEDDTDDEVEVPKKESRVPVKPDKPDPVRKEPRSGNRRWSRKRGPEE